MLNYVLLCVFRCVIGGMCQKNQFHIEFMLAFNKLLYLLKPKGKMYTFSTHKVILNVYK